MPGRRTAAVLAVSTREEAKWGVRVFRRSAGSVHCPVAPRGRGRWHRSVLTTARLQRSSSGLTYSEVALSGIVQGRGSLAVGWDGSRFISFQKEMDNLCMA